MRVKVEGKLVSTIETHKSVAILNYRLNDINKKNYSFEKEIERKWLNFIERGVWE